MNSESFEQRQLIQWCRTRPELQFLFHIPNESVGGQGWIIRNRQLGVKSGVPDLMLPIPAGDYHGLFVEMKTKGGRVSETQKKWIDALNGLGYLAVVAYGWEDARCSSEDNTAARSPLFSIEGPLAVFIFTLSSFAII